MTIEAFLDQADDKDIQKIEDLGSSEYQGLATVLSIDKAEQSILDSVTAVDDDEDENEQQELDDERQMKTLFESLYEIDPETKEPFVKGSAYDLKKWDEDMVCFAFGEPEHVIALESACVTDPFILSPEEEHFVRYYDGINSHLINLKNLMTHHKDALTGGTINRKFAEDFKEVMGYPIPNIRMESFTRELTKSNFTIAMEEVSAQQAALMAGGALVGLGIVYKLIQWFAKALNRNGAATSSISGNIAEFRDRQERRANAGNEFKVNRDVLQKELEEIKKLSQQTENDKALQSQVTRMQEAMNHILSSTKEGDEAVAISKEDVASMEQIYWSATASKQMNIFLRTMASRKLDETFWGTFNSVVKEAAGMQSKVSSYIERIATERKVDDAQLADTLNFKTVMDLANKLRLENILSLGKDAAVNYDASSNNWADAGARLQTLVTRLTEHNATFSPDISMGSIADSLSKIDVQIFESLGDDYLKNLTQHGEKLKKLSEDSFKEDKADKEMLKTNGVDKDKLRQAISQLVAAFRLLSSILRFAISVRNSIGVLAISANKTMEKTSWVDKAAGVVATVKNKFNS